ncbi:hypothetical protein CQA78_23530 [Klebsiella pneumoniae]|nr:hypothetical protein CQA78_23530 [Klebsiella pneumoniae]
MPAGEWQRIDRGIRQRVKALNAFLYDIYHEQNILRAGLIPAEQVLANEQYQPCMQGINLPNNTYAHITGVDMVRNNDGQYYVLEDNLRTPSGVSYMLENRKMMMRLYPEMFEQHHIAPVERYPSYLLQTLRESSLVDDPCVVVMTPGRFNSAYFEHSFLAQQMGVELVESADLLLKTARCICAPPRPRRVDVIYRRIDDAWLDPLAKLITYPRSDSRYLPEEHFAGRHAVLNAIAVHAADLLPQPVVDPEIRNRCWDDKKVDAHHAIIPTARSSQVKLTDNEAKVYTLIARQYLMQFCPDAVFRKCQIDLEIANGKFVAKARFLAEAGWRTLLGSKERDEENDGTPLPVVAKGDELLCERGEVVERQTQPPRHFTDATLLSAMTGIARFVQDKDLKKILRATDGLGTEATRAGIIELLFKRGFLSKKGRYIHSSEAGRALIHSLPEMAGRPDMTAHWESVLTQISEKQCRYQDFMQPLVGTLYQLIDQARSTPVRQFRGLVAPGGAKKSFSKGKGKPKGKKAADDTAPPPQ